MKTDSKPSPVWARRLRAALLSAVAALFVISIPWYRGDGPPGQLLGLPDWVAVALMCYALAAVLNAVAWLLTEIPDEPPDAEGPGS